MGCTVRELLHRIDSKELTEWMAFYQLEPWGADVDDWRAGMIASTVANVHRDPKKRREPFSPQDFMPQRAEVAQEQRPEDHEAILRLWQRALQGVTRQ